MQGADEVDQIPDIPGAQYGLPCRHDFSSIGNPIGHYSVREIRRRGNAGQIFRALRECRSGRSVPASFGTMARFTVMLEQLSSSTDRLRSAWNGVWRNRCLHEVQIIDPNASAHDQSRDQDPCHSNCSNHFGETRSVPTPRRNWHTSNPDLTGRTESAVAHSALVPGRSSRR